MQKGCKEKSQTLTLWARSAMIKLTWLTGSLAESGLVSAYMENRGSRLVSSNTWNWVLWPTNGIEENCFVLNVISKGKPPAPDKHEVTTESSSCYLRVSLKKLLSTLLPRPSPQKKKEKKKKMEGSSPTVMGLGFRDMSLCIHMHAPRVYNTQKGMWKCFYLPQI